MADAKMKTKKLKTPAAAATTTAAAKFSNIQRCTSQENI